MPILTIDYPNIDPIIFEIWIFKVRWYGLAYVAGLLLGLWYLKKILGNHKLWDNGPVISAEKGDDILLWVALGVIVGGRLGEVFFYDHIKYFSNPLKILWLTEGGMSFHGGFIGVILMVWLFARRNKVSFLSLIDVIAAVVPIGLFFGRIANFINAELYGRITDVPWAMIFPTDPTGEPRHPSQLYEAALEGILLYLVLRVFIYNYKKLNNIGFISGAFAIGYGLFRIFVEFFREPDAHIGYIFNYFTIGMLLSLPMVMIGVVLVIYSYLYSRQKNDKA